MNEGFLVQPRVILGCLLSQMLYSDSNNVVLPSAPGARSNQAKIR